MYHEAATRPKKWIFGGQETVIGSGDTIIPSFRRPYHECGYWKLRASFGDGRHFDSAITEFCSG